MKMRILKYILPVFVGAGLMVSCFPEDDLKYSGPPLVEFKNHTREWSATLLTTRGIVTTAGTQTDSTRTVQEVTRVRDTVLVQVIGPQTASDRLVDFSVRATSTAVHGVHYNFNASNNYNVAASTGTVTIPANSSVGYLILDLIDAQAAAATVRVDIDLTGSSDLGPSPLFDVFKVTIRGQ